METNILRIAIVGMKRIFFLLIVSISISVYSQTNVVHISPQAVLPQNSVTYFLPKTELVVTVRVRKSIQRAGRFANYAKRLLEFDNTITSDKTSFVIDAIELTSNPVPDSTRQYAIEISPKSVAYKITTDIHGVILGVNMPSALQQAVRDTEYLSAKSIDTAIIFDYSVLNEDALGATTEEKMAEMAAKQILDIRESRMELLTGDTERGYDGASLQKVLDRLETTERKLTELFVGKTLIISEDRVFRVAPTTAVEDEVLFRFSSVVGVLDADDYAGSPVYISVTPIATKLVDTDMSKTKRFGIFYNNIAKADVKISDIDKQWVDKVVVMPQFGQTAFLPAKIFDKPDTAVEFTEYGTIKSVR